MIAALYVETDGIYFGRDDVDPYDVKRDARTYAGPYPVVAHPPCARWGRLWWTDGSTAPGDDGGLFEHALRSVRKWGGVIEHPAESFAYKQFDLPKPARGVWIRGICGGWVTEVSQSAYGHRAQKRTWLYLVGMPLDMNWTDVPCNTQVSPGGAHGISVMGRKERRHTPEPFAEALIELAENAVAGSCDA